MPPRRTAGKDSGSAPSTPKKRPRKKAIAPPTPNTPSTQSEQPSDEPTIRALLGHTTATSAEWFHTKSTTTNYRNNVKAGKAWLATWAKDAGDGGSEGMPAGAEGYQGDISSLADAFDTIKEETPLALRLWIAYKCDHQNCGFSTAESHRAAFKDYFERELGCQGDFWRFNSHTSSWEGNPVFQTDFKVYFESLKHRQNRTATANQALPMLPKDMKIILDYLSSSEAATALTDIQRSFYKAFSTTAFNLWTRNEELVNFRYGDLSPHQSPDSGQPYHEFRLIFRKTNKDPTHVQSYYVPVQPTMPEIDCYTHLSLWLSLLQSQLGRPLEAQDYIFPAIASTGKLKFGEPMTRAGVEKLLDLVTSKSGVLKGRNGKFTTHCFRRGGAQYRFMWAETRWSLKAVKWWGGWSSSENVGTIMRYLLDELTAYEEGFTDILMNNRSNLRHENFMGMSTPTTPLTHQDLDALEILPALQSAQPASQEGSPSARRILEIPSVASPSNPPDNPFASSIPSSLTSLDPAPRQSPAEEAALSSSAVPPRIPMTQSMDDVIKYWTVGDPEKGLIHPLQDWSWIYGRKAYLSEEQKLSNIRILYEEYQFYKAVGGGTTGTKGER
ncbi:hypothetical protein ONZ45_g14383 [Pleurotus djamor]|nr:hypothetical protein ONZ45_g14383 [Pleurotus djamor]